MPSDEDPASGPVLHVDNLVHDYHALRPLRIQQLEVAAGELVALTGLDEMASEVFVNLLTGAVLPQEGEVRVFGRSTAAIQDDTDWFATLDRFGLVSPRVVLLSEMSIAQNLAVPFTLDLEPMSQETRNRVACLAEEAGLPAARLEDQVGSRPGPLHLRVRLARALAGEPRLLVLEHPTSGLDGRDTRALAQDLRRLTGQRSLATLILTADRRFASAAADRVLTVQCATGALFPLRRGWL